MIGIYCRISRKKEEGRNVSIPDQVRKGKEKAKELGLDYKTYTDEGVSGTAPIEERPAFAQLISDIKDDILTHVYAVDQSRIERDIKVRYVVVEIFKEHNISYITDMDGEVDLFDPQQEFMGDMISLINSFHVTTSKIKSKSALLNRVIEGKAHSCNLPYGYRKDENGYLAIDDEEAEIIKKIYELSLSGLGQGKIAQYLNDNQVKTRYNKYGKGSVTVVNQYTKKEKTILKKDIRWSSNTVRGHIINTIYKGKRKYKGEFYDAPSIFPPEYWQKVNDNLKNNANNTGKKVKHRYMLKGLLRCGRCGRNYYGRSRVSRKDHYYQCSSKRVESCGNRSINIDKLEEFIWTNTVVHPNMTDKIKKEFNANAKLEELKIQKEDVSREIRRLKRTLQDVLKLVGTLSIEDIQPKLKSVKREITDQEYHLEDINKRIEAIEKEKELAEKFSLRKLDVIGEQFSFERKRDLVKELVRNIIIFYYPDTKRFDVFIQYAIDIRTLKASIYLNEDNWYLEYDGHHSPKIDDSLELLSSQDIDTDEKLDIMFSRPEFEQFKDKAKFVNMVEQGWVYKRKDSLKKVVQ